MILKKICDLVTWKKRKNLSNKLLGNDLDCTLESKEILAVNQTFGRLGLKPYYTDYKVFKKLIGFDARYVPDDIQIPYIIKSLNPPAHILALEHKGLYPILYKGMNLPKTLVVCINGVLFDAEMNIVTTSESVTLLKAVDKCIVKPTSFSGCGSGIKIISTESIQKTEVNEYITEYKGNFIAQRLVKQSSQMSKLSKNSLNTFRISTLFINGKFSVCSITCRVGMGDSYLDNVATGNVMVGVKMDGQFMKYAYDSRYGKHTKTDTGVIFSKFKIGAIDKMLAFVEQHHKKNLPHCGFIGWDIALDENEEPVMIEVNLYGAGVHFEQLAVEAPLYGDRTDEVIEYVNNHKPSVQSILTNWSWM